MDDLLAGFGKPLENIVAAAKAIDQPSVDQSFFVADVPQLNVEQQIVEAL